MSLYACCISELLQGLRDGICTGVHDLWCKTQTCLHKQHMCAAKLPSICSIDSVMQVGVKC